MTLSPAMAEAAPGIFALMIALAGWVTAHYVAYRPKGTHTRKP